MPSPFPGMDPFLENPVWFGGFHNKLITHLEEALQPILPRPYYANSGEDQAQGVREILVRLGR